MTFSPSANFTMRNAPLKYIESAGMPQRILMTRDWPPMRVGAAVQQVRRRDAAGERVVDDRIVVLELHLNFGRHRLAAFVDAVFERGVRVRVDDAGHDELARAVDDANARPGSPRCVPPR